VPAGDELTDAAQALIAVWNNGAINCPGKLREGDDSLEPPDNQPYAGFTVKQGPRPNEFTSGPEFISFVEITINIWGIGLKDVGAVVAAARVALETTWTVANASFMRLEILPGWTNVNEKEARAGQKYRRAVMRYCLWTHRT
jgi:hypothetical protein